MWLFCEIIFNMTLDKMTLFLVQFVLYFVKLAMKPYNFCILSLQMFFFICIFATKYSIHEVYSIT